MRIKDFVRRLKGLVARLFIERRNGLDTTDIVELADVNIQSEGRSNYIPSGWGTMRYVARFRPISSDDVFVDFGSGKGRMVFLAAHYPFKRVIGVELSKDLHAIAQVNIDKTMWRFVCRNIELQNCDASQYLVPEDMTVAYMYHPFVGPPFKKMIDNIEKSYARNRRRITIFYTNPIMHDYVSSREWLATRVYVQGNVGVYETIG